MNRHSLLVKSVIAYILLAMMNSSFFVLLIFQNQMDLIAENSKFKAQEYIKNILVSLKQYEGEFLSSNKPFNLKEFSLLADSATKNWILFQENGSVLAAAPPDLKLPESYMENGIKALAERDLMGNGYYMVSGKAGEELQFYIPIGKTSGDNIVLYTTYIVSEMQSGLKDVYRMSLLVIFLMIVFHTLFAIAIYIIVIRPIRTLNKVSTEISSGNYESRVPVKSKDEIGLLAQTFNVMAQAVQEKIALLHGDYFLSTLLLVPLCRNTVKSDSVKIETFIKQKMSFAFKKWIREIGGDICMAHNVNLKDKSYVFFINADAMGKSIQGAGGIIVMGAVIEAFINRTNYTRREKDVYPEVWIRNLFFELQRIFETFDGSMLVSATFGLIEEETGMLFYINCEHPWTVLYREGRASFLDRELLLRKLGIENNNNSAFSVRVFRMENGDTLVTGSDGRDDLLLGRSIDGNRVINEDENLFLAVVEKSDSDIGLMYQNLQSYGEITDDVSLLKLKYRNTGSNDMPDSVLSAFKKAFSEKIAKNLSSEALKMCLDAEKKYGKHSEICKSIASILINDEKYGEAERYLFKYTEMRPEDNDYLFNWSVCLSRLDKYCEARFVAERLYLREPDNLKYLLHYMKMLYLDNDFAFAKNIINIILNKQPQNDDAFKMLEIIEEKEALQAIK